MPAPGREQLQEEIDAIGWWHSIDLGDGLVTPGRKGGAEYMAQELAALALPPLAGRTVLDIGAWDGFYSFHAEQAGAARVTALDHFVWDRSEHNAGRGFDLAHRVLRSSVQKVHQDWQLIDAATLGTYDVVLFLGVLYHLEAPLTGLRRVIEFVAPGGTAVIESEAMELRRTGDRPLAEFFPGAERNDDETNWWAPNIAALTALCRAAGFSSVRVVQGPRGPRVRQISRYRAIVHATR
jgi:tRNA (mo5U34)-methyltransferase